MQYRLYNQVVFDNNNSRSRTGSGSSDSVIVVVVVVVATELEAAENKMQLYVSLVFSWTAKI